jgi:hypothetical protein
MHFWEQTCQGLCCLDLVHASAVIPCTCLIWGFLKTQSVVTQLSLLFLPAEEAAPQAPEPALSAEPQPLPQDATGPAEATAAAPGQAVTVEEEEAVVVEMQAEEPAAVSEAREGEAPVAGKDVAIVARMEHPVEFEEEGVRSACLFSYGKNFLCYAALRMHASRHSCCFLVKARL